MIGIALLCVLLGLRVEYLRRMAVYHDLEADKARLLFAPDGYATDDDASYNTMMSQKQKAHEYRQAIYGPWGRKWGDLSGLQDDYREPLRTSNPPAP
jgi:hypothetical protein